MLRGELGGRQFDQTRSHGARPTIFDSLRYVVENLREVRYELDGNRCLDPATLFFTASDEWHSRARLM